MTKNPSTRSLGRSRSPQLSLFSLGSVNTPQIFMRSQLILLLAVSAICQTVGTLRASGTVAEAQLQIQMASRALIEAQLRYDAPGVARLLADDFVYVGHDGSLARKTEFLPAPRIETSDRCNHSSGSSRKFDSMATPQSPSTLFMRKASRKESHANFEVVHWPHG
jgi:hypothetical protein